MAVGDRRGGGNTPALRQAGRGGRADGFAARRSEPARLEHAVVDGVELGEMFLRQGVLHDDVPLLAERFTRVVVHPSQAPRLLSVPTTAAVVLDSQRSGGAVRAEAKRRRWRRAGSRPWHAQCGRQARPAWPVRPASASSRDEAVSRLINQPPTWITKWVYFRPITAMGRLPRLALAYVEG